MSDVVSLAVSVLSQAERRVEIAAQNIANSTTPAYKRRVPFSTLVGQASSVQGSIPTVSAAIDFSVGKIAATGNPTHLAISGPGYFELRRDGEILYSRQGQFALDPEGRLTTAEGFALQLSSGNDLIVTNDRFQVDRDGSVRDGQTALGKIAVYAASNEHGLEPKGNGFVPGRATFDVIEAAQITQGGYETSNVTSGTEMVVLMEALRRAESGQRLMSTYDDMMARAITSFGESIR